MSESGVPLRPDSIHRTSVYYNFTLRLRPDSSSRLASGVERQSDGVVVEGVVVHPSPRSCSCSCSYARPLNINKGIVSLCPLSRRSVARQPLPLRQIKLAL